MDKYNFYGDNNQNNDIIVDKSISYSLNFFDSEGNEVDTIYFDQDTILDDEINDYEINENTSFLSIIMSYKLNGAFRYDVLCSYYIETEISIIDSKWVCLKNGLKLYGEYRIVKNLDELNNVLKFIVDSFSKNKLPVEGDYYSVINEIEFVKNFSK